jgi:hypothetical protein
MAYLSRYRRGMGDAQCPSADQLAGIVNPLDPCQCLAGSGPLQPGQSYCAGTTPAGTPAGLDLSSLTNLFTPTAVTPGATGPTCFTALFPFMGNTNLATGSCVPALGLPPIAGVAITGLLVFGLAKALLGGGRR